MEPYIVPLDPWDIHSHDIDSLRNVTVFGKEVYPEYRIDAGDMPADIWDKWDENDGPIHAKYFDHGGDLNEEAWILPPGSKYPVVEVLPGRCRRNVCPRVPNTRVYELYRIDGPALRYWMPRTASWKEIWCLGGEDMTEEEHRRTLALRSGRKKVLKAARLLTVASVVPSVSDDTLSAVGQFL